ncbi:neutral/alkaline non-lysosomal ceramidase N-terminal domain-containing protein [bacterium]|nr:neutral/alkaline non-lysosomal ceramidase N-terminal domain-containing protein [bacterium]
MAPQDISQGPSRRNFLKGAAAAVLAGSLAGTLGAAEKPLGTEPASAEGSPLPFKIGVSEIDITPTWKTMLAGFEHRTKPSEGAYQPIHVKCLTIGDGKNKVVYLVAETVYFDTQDRPWGIIDAINKELKRKHGINPGQVIMMATHNHSAPVMGDERFRAWLVEKSIEAVDKALASEREARLFFGRGSSSIGVSRRGTDMNGDDTWEINPYGFHDPEVVVLKFVDRAGKPIALSFAYSCHPTTIGSNFVGGDYAGFAQAEMSSRLGGIPAIFMQGTCGDMKPDNHRPESPFNFYAPAKVHVDEVKKIGVRLADDITKALASPMEEITGPIRIGHAHVEFPVLSAWTGTNGIETDAVADPSKPLSGPTRRMARMARRVLASMDKNGRYNVTQPGDLAVVRIGDKFVHACLPGEMCSPIGLRVKDELRGSQVMVTAYAGLYIGYFPGQAQIAAGGYEVFGNFHRLPYSPEAEDVLIYSVMQTVKSLAGKA